MASRDRRRAPRAAKRLKVEYGPSSFEHVGFSRDISIGGLYLMTRKLLPAGTRVHMRVSFGSTAFVSEGEVVRHHSVHPAMRQIDQSGMGIRFISAQEMVEQLVPAQLRSDVAHVLSYTSKTELRELLEQQLVHGVVLLPMAGQIQDVGTVLEFEVCYGQREPIRARGRVMQILQTGFKGKPGLVVKLESLDLRSHIEQLLGGGSP